MEPYLLIRKLTFILFEDEEPGATARAAAQSCAGRPAKVCGEQPYLDPPPPPLSSPNPRMCRENKR